MSNALTRFLPSFLRPRPAEQKALTTIRHEGSMSFMDSLLPATRVDYAKEVGDGMGSSVLSGPLNFVMRTFPEAPPVVERYSGEEWKPEPTHKLLHRLSRPNPYYSGRTLWTCLSLDLCFGNAYILKLRNLAGEVVQLWWAPRQMIEPKWPQDGSKFISHYEYSAGGIKTPIRPEDVVHVRFGLDPRNPRMGLSPLGALMREIAVDDHAANFTASILKNLGIIGLVISPEKGMTNPEALKEVKEYVRTQFTGDRRAEPLVATGPTKVDLLQYNLQGFDVSPIRDVSEERICAALGIPAAVVGFGTGLHQTKVGATMKEMRQLAWTSGIIPLQDTVADELDRSLLPDFEGSMATHDWDAEQDARVRFDTSKVRALWENTNEKHTRVREDFEAKIIDRAEARRETGRAVRTEDEGKFYDGTPSAGKPKPPAPPAAQPEPEE